MGGNTSTILGVVGAAVGGYFGGPAGAALGMSIGSTIGGVIDPPNIPGPKLGDARIQTSRDNIPIPVSWARSHVIGNIIQMNPIREVTKEVGGKGGGPTTTETRRYRTFAIGIGRSYYGPIGGIARIWENNKLVYDTRDTPAIPADETAAFAEGITIYLGDEGQMPDPELESNTGVGLCPAYRGLAYIVFNDKDLTDFGSSIPTYRFEIISSYPVEATSHIYPIEALDAIEAACAFTSGQINEIASENMDLLVPVFMELEMREVLKELETEESMILTDPQLIGLTMREVLKDANTEENMILTDPLFIELEMRIALVEHEIEPDELQAGSEFTSGTITPV